MALPEPQELSQRAEDALWVTLYAVEGLARQLRKALEGATDEWVSRVVRLLNNKYEEDEP